MYGNHRSHSGMDSLPRSGAEYAPMTGDTVETYALGTVFATPNGPVALEALRIGDQIIDKYGDIRTLLWIREDRNSVLGMDDAVLKDAVGRQTRFPGVRFVRGRRADIAYKVVFSDPVVLQNPAPQSELQTEPEYVAEFSSSRARAEKDDSETPLAAE